MNSQMWQFLLPYMENDFNILTYDLYGHGRTMGNGTPLSISGLANEVIALLNHLHLEKVHFVCCRFSTILAFKIELEAPGYVESITSMSLPLYLQPQKFIRKCETDIQLLTADPHLFEKKYILENVYPVTDSKSRMITNALRLVPCWQMTSLIQELINQVKSPEYNAIKHMKKIDKPVLFMHGEFDPVFPAALAAIFCNFVPNSQFMVIPESSSLIPLDQPGFAAIWIKKFIKGEHSASSLTPDSKNVITIFNAMIEKNIRSRIIPSNQRYLRLSMMTGEVHIYWNGQELIGNWNKRNAKELILFVILNHGTVKRDMIINAFKPDVEINQARNYLRVQLSSLKKLFLSQADSSLHNLLIVDRYSVTLNADLESDIGIFIENIKELLWSKKTAEERSQIFCSLLGDYHPDIFAKFRGEWISQIASNVKNRLSQIMVQILQDLKKEGETFEIQRILIKGKIVEPYIGFCDNWMESLL
jgi:pimeloyl-ACP methyl ester carboxylesterase